MDDQNEDYGNLYPPTPQPPGELLPSLNQQQQHAAHQAQQPAHGVYQPTDYTHFPGERNNYYYDYNLPTVNMATYDYLNAYTHNDMDVQLHQQQGDTHTHTHRSPPALPLNYLPHHQQTDATTGTATNAHVAPTNINNASIGGGPLIHLHPLHHHHHHPPPPEEPIQIDPITYNTPIPIQIPIPNTATNPNVNPIPIPNAEMILPTSTDPWNTKYNLLHTFKARHGHVDVPQKYKEDKPLGKWVGRQREQYKVYCKNQIVPPNDRVACALTDDRIHKLNEVGFKWTIGKGQYGKIHGIFDGNEPHNRAWEEKFVMLEQYKAFYGDLNLPNVTSTGKFDAPIPLEEWGEDGAGDSHGNHNDNVLNMGEGGGGERETESTDAGSLKEEDIKSLSRWVKSQKQKYQDVQEHKVAAGQALERRFIRLVELGVDLSNTRYPNRISSRNASKAKQHQGNIWESRYHELCDYVKEHGHANVPTSDKENVQLARWVGAQRECYKTKKRHLEQSQRSTNIHLAKKSAPAPSLQKEHALTDERIELLEKIGFEFSIQDNRWDERLKELAEYKAKKKHVRVRHSENKQLYEWTSRQRNLFREYMQGSTTSGNLMTNDRVTRLENLGFKWKYTFEPLNEKRLEAAVAFAEKGGRKKEGKALKSSSETEKEIHAITNTNANANLNSVDFSVAYLMNGPTRHPQESNGDDASATSSQGDLQLHNFDGLDQILPIPVELNHNHHPHEINANAFNKVGTQHKRGTKPQLWHQQYEQLAEFEKENGHCRVPGRYPANSKLGMWVKLQREDHKHLLEGKLSPMNDFRIDLLNKIGFEWSVFGPERANSWNIKIAELKAFKDEYGHCDVPQKFEPNRALGKWVSKQREAYRSYCMWRPSSLTKERLDLLVDVEFRFNVGRGRATRTWDSFFNDLVAFTKKFGHSNVPVSYADDPSFGKWVYQQRLHLHKRLAGKATNGITKKRLDKLQTIDFAFHVKEIDQVRKRRSDFGVARGKKPKNSEKDADENEDEGHASESAGQLSVTGVAQSDTLEQV